MNGRECHQWAERKMTHIYQKVAVLTLLTAQIDHLDQMHLHLRPALTGSTQRSQAPRHQCFLLPAQATKEILGWPGDLDPISAASLTFSKASFLLSQPPVRI